MSNELDINDKNWIRKLLINTKQSAILSGSAGCNVQVLINQEILNQLH